MQILEISDNARENWEIMVHPILTKTINNLHSEIDSVEDCNVFSRTERKVLMKKIEKLMFELADFEPYLHIHFQKLQQVYNFLFEC